MKLASVLLGLVLCCTCVGCGDKKDPPSEKGLPDYDIAENTFRLPIAGWVMPSRWDESAADDALASGINVLHIAGAGAMDANVSHPTQKLLDALGVCDRKGMDVYLHVGAKNADLLENIAKFTQYDSVLGITFDEPNKSQIDEISAKLQNFCAVAQGKTLFTNLYPSFATDVKNGFASYNDYLRYYCDKVLAKLTAGEKWLSADRYPLVYDARGNKSLDTGWLADIDAVANVAREYENVKTNFFIQTMPYGRDEQTGERLGARENSRDRVPTYEDVRLQEYTLLCFGYDGISCFCYGTPAVGKEFTEEQTAMIDREGNKTTVYDAVKKANAEIAAFDHVMSQFAWKGVFTNDKETTTADKDRTQNASFKNIASRKSVKEIDCLSSVYSSQDTLFGWHEDKEGNNGFTVVNYNETSLALTDTVTLRFDPSYKFSKALCYVGGQKKILTVKDDALTLTLGAGEGVFVIPYEG